MSNLRRHIMMQKAGGEYDTNKYLATLSSINPNFTPFNLGNVDLSQIRVLAKASFLGYGGRANGDYAYQIAYTATYGSFMVNYLPGVVRCTTGGRQDNRITNNYAIGDLLEIETTYGKLILNGATYTQSLPSAQTVPLSLLILQFGICKLYFIEVYNGSTLMHRLSADEQNGQKGLIDDVSGIFMAAINQDNVIIGYDA